jgi:hypothetical protein
MRKKNLKPPRRILRAEVRNSVELGAFGGRAAGDARLKVSNGTAGASNGRLSIETLSRV